MQRISICICWPTVMSSGKTCKNSDRARLLHSTKLRHGDPRGASYEQFGCRRVRYHIYDNLTLHPATAEDKNQHH